MCTARSILFFGVFIETAYLCFASDAYKATKGSLLALDLVVARRRKGSLSTTKATSSLLKVPEEVWKMIKVQVARVVMLEVEKDAVRKFVGYQSWDEKDGHTWRDGMVNDAGLQSFFDADGISAMLEQRMKDISSLLDTFGLVLPFDSPYSREEYAPHDLDALSAISLPLQSTSSSSRSLHFPLSQAVSSPEDGLAHEAVRISNQTFARALDDGQRFKAFLSFFGLEVVNAQLATIYDHSQPKIDSSTSQVQSKDRRETEKGSENQKQSHESICCDKGNAEPHWHMWTVAQCM
ncbi:hypothetical protein JCM5353_002107 [Sporobolomyces roseus]